jgi:hypothetical protein
VIELMAAAHGWSRARRAEEERGALAFLETMR